MPSTITHTFISIDTLKKINPKPKKILTKNIENYKTFAQGMDILYFYHIFFLKTNKIQKLGHKFHNFKTNDIFKEIINENKKSKEDIIFTFLSGLITHYCADSIIHPYINYLAQHENRIKHSDLHFEIETFLDNYMLDKNKIPYKNFKSYTLQFNSKTNNEIINLINKIYLKYFNYPNMGKKYYQGLKEMYLVFKYLRYDKYGIKRKLYQVLDKNDLNVRRLTYLSYNFPLKNMELYLNNQHKTWYNIKDRTIISNKSFDDLYNDVLIESSKIINSLYNYIYEDKKIDLDKLLGNRSYSTGLIIK